MFAKQPSLSVLVLLFTLIPTVTLAAPATSATGVTMRVEPYFNGHFKFGEWLPLRITLANDGTPLRAQVRAETTVYSSPITYITPVELPTGARKSIILYVQPPSFGQTLRVRLVAGTRELDSQSVPVVLEPNTNYVVGVIAPRAESFAVLHNLSLNALEVQVEVLRKSYQPFVRPVKMLPLSVSDIPERLEGLRTLDALIISGVDTSGLSPEQGRALQTWVDQGGRLIVGGGASATRTLAGLPEELVKEFRPTGNSINLLSLEALGKFAEQEVRVPGPFAATISAGGYPLIEQDGQPLLVETYFGRGHVNYSSLDLAASPFDAWTGSAHLWEKLLTPRSALPYNRLRDVSPRPMNDDSVSYVLQTLPTLRQPPLSWLVGLLTLFILLVGPVNYLVLRRLRRLAWSRITVPTLTVFFLAWAIWLGYGVLGSDVIINQVSILSLSPRAAMPAQTYVSVSAPTQTTYTLDMPGRMLVARVTRRGHLDLSADADTTVEIVQGDSTQVRGILADPKASQAIRTESPLPEGWRIESKLALEGDHVRGTIVNHTSETIRDAVFVNGNHFARLGDLPPGQTRSLNRALERPAEESLYSTLFAVFGDPRLNAPSDPPRLRYQLLSDYYQSFGGTAQLPSTLMLIGWMDASPLQVQISGVRWATRQMSMVIANLDPQSFSGPIYMTRGRSSVRLVSTQGDAALCSPGPETLNVNSGSAEVEFELPEELMPLRLTRLELIIQGTLATQIEALDRDGEWVKLEPPGRGTYELPDPNRFLLPDYVIRFRLSGVRGIPACDYYELAAQGEK